jgi:two-component sensor histidine kinase
MHLKVTTSACRVSQIAPCCVAVGGSATKIFRGTMPLPADGFYAQRDAADVGNREVSSRARMPDLSLRTKVTAPPRSSEPPPVPVPSSIFRATRLAHAHPALGFGAAVLLIAAATALQWWARDFYQGAPFLTIYPAVIVAAFIGGYKPGLLAAALAGVSQWYFFIPGHNVAAIASYAIDATLCVLLIECINRSLAKEIEAREHQRLLKDELSHRIQNTLAVIQAVIRFSLPEKNEPVLPALVEARLLARLQAMSDANRFIGNVVGKAALLALIDSQIRGLESQIDVEGRADVMLDAQMTQNLSLVLHELVTNSLKYGALSSLEGRVRIVLTETPTEIKFDWLEAGGPAVREPSSDGSGSGFGSRILGPFARGFCADVTLSYEPSGLRYALRIPREPQAA